MDDPFSLDGRCALVTGAGRGLGLEMAKGLARAGARVFVNGRQPDTLSEAVEAIRGFGGRAEPLAFDVTDTDGAASALASIAGEHGGLDILVNNVGVRDRRGLQAFDGESVRRLMETNLVAPFMLCREAARLMVPRGRGRIVNITSIAGPIARGGDAPYTASKGALEALTRALAAELGGHGITVNAVAPGYFATETNKAMAADPEIAAWLAQRTALGRWGRAEEIAGAVVFLASDAASYVSGQVIVVDGGHVTHF